MTSRYAVRIVRRHRLSASLLMASSLFMSGNARADVAACVTAHAHGQAERNAGRLQSARGDFLSCSTSQCPSEIQRECATFLAQVDESMASVVFSAIDAHGNDATQVSVSVDGTLVLTTLTGLSTPLDPGSHAISYTWPDGFEQKQTVVVAQGEKNRRVELRRPPSEPAVPVANTLAPASAPVKSRPLAAYVLGGVGVAALGSFAAFAITGKIAERDMAGCKPFCEQSQADKMRLRYLIADVSLAVGLVSLGAGGYLYFSASRAPGSGALNGGSLTARGSF